jgi:hypothetical protein
MADITWHRAGSGYDIPTNRRLLLIAKPLGAPGLDLVIGHWHAARDVYVAVEPPYERGGVRPALQVQWWAEIPECPNGVEIRKLAPEDMRR